MLPHERRSPVIIAVVSLLMVVLTLMTLVGNTALVTVLLRNKKQSHQTGNMFVINLAITDALLAIFIMIPDITSVVADHWVLGMPLCNINCATNYFCIVATMTTFSYIGMDRFVAVCDPLHYRQRQTRRKALLEICSSYVMGFIIFSMPVCFRWIEYDYTEMGCAINWFSQDMNMLTFVIVGFITCFMGPFSVMIFCYVRIAVEIHRTSQKTLAMSAAGASSAAQKGQSLIQARNKKLVLTNLMLLAIFVITLTPFSATKMIKAATGKEDLVPSYINGATTIFQFTGSAVSPFLYGILRKEIFNELRDDLRGFFRCCAS